MKKVLIAALGLAMMVAPAMANKGDHFAMMDSDSNGSVSKSEYDSYKDRKFSEMDTNSDSMLSKQEMQAHKNMKKDTKSDMRE
jgi:hypothetical protein